MRLSVALFMVYRVPLFYWGKNSIAGFRGKTILVQVAHVGPGTITKHGILGQLEKCMLINGVGTLQEIFYLCQG